MKSLIDKSAPLFDILEDYWESRANMKRIGVILILFYIGALLVIQINIWGWLPEKLAGHITTNRFNSIGVAFTLLLVVEVISLVFALATVILRLALSSPPYINVILGFSAALFVMGLIYVYTKYGTYQLRE